MGREKVEGGGEERSSPLTTEVREGEGEGRGRIKPINNRG